MLPASHALTGYLAARFLRWRVGPEHDPSPWRPDPLVVIAVVGTLFPDWDLLPSFLLDCEWPVRCRDWPEFHRGPTHSVVGTLLQAPLLAAPFRYAWRRLFGNAPPLKLLTGAAFLGLLSHVFWDLLNPWGVELYWPFSSRPVSGHLLHGQDLVVLAVLLLCSLLVWRAKFTAGFLAAVLLLPGYLLFQLNFRARATQIAARQFPAAAIRPYPNPRLGCPWLVGVELEGAIEGHCLSRPWDTATRLALSVPLDSHPAIEATLQLWEVADFVAERTFTFAEVHPQDDGQFLVVWRDLREAVLEIGAPEPSGLHVRVNAAGEIVDYRKKWFLRPLL